MTSCQTLTIGPAPAEAECAQLGITACFDLANGLELRCYQAALIACHGRPPESARFQLEYNHHDFGTYRELAVRYDPDADVAATWAFEVGKGLGRWREADFLVPVMYDSRSQVIEIAYTDHFGAARRAMVMLERLRIDGFATAAQVVRIANLRAAYPTQGDEADGFLRQLATETELRAPEDRRVELSRPYRLTFMPAAFNDYRGVHYPKGDVIDVHAHELRAGGRRIMACLGCVATPDDALALCWEHMARYVIA